MGGCASKPKEFNDEKEPAPVEAPATTAEAPVATEKVDGETVPQENKDADEAKKEEPLVDLSEPAESKPVEETAKAAEEANEPPKEEKSEAAGTEAAVPKSEEK